MLRQSRLKKGVPKNRQREGIDERSRFGHNHGRDEEDGVSRKRARQGAQLTPSRTDPLGRPRRLRPDEGGSRALQSAS